MNQDSIIETIRQYGADLVWQESFFFSRLSELNRENIRLQFLEGNVPNLAVEHHEGVLVLVVPRSTTADIMRLCGNAAPASSHVLILVEENATLTYASLFHGKTQQASETIVILNNANVSVNGCGLNTEALDYRLQLIALGQGSSTHTSVGMNVPQHQKHACRVDNIFSGKNNSGKITFHGILEDHGHLDVEGKIRILHGANGTDSSLAEKMILLGKHSACDAKPIIAIDTDDVKAGHGASITRIHEEDMFYLTSRGLKENEAHTLMKHAFIKSAFDTLDPNHRFVQTVEKHLIDSNES